MWAGLIVKEQTGITDKDLYIQILENTLKPFIQAVYPNGHLFMADNDPKHTSQAAERYLTESIINCWCTPAESPDLNLVENLWHELKEFMRHEIKPKTKDQLVEGVLFHKYM